MKTIIPENVTELEEIKLMHPRTEEETTFMISNGVVYEPRVYTQEIGSLFIGDTVDQDTSITFITPVDELFLILPLLIQHKKQFRSLSDIIPDGNSLSKLDFEKILPIITDVKDVDDVNYYRYSHEKVTQWLKDKVTATSTVVLEKQINFTSKSTGLVALRKKSVSLDDVELRRYSFRLVADYLSEETAKEFTEILGLKEDEEEERVSKVGGDDTIESTTSTTTGKPKEDYYKSPTKEEKKAQEKKVLTRAQKTLAKVDKKGMKSINSYFSKK